MLSFVVSGCHFLFLLLFSFFDLGNFDRFCSTHAGLVNLNANGLGIRFNVALGGGFSVRLPIRCGPFVCGGDGGAGFRGLAMVPDKHC